MKEEFNDCNKNYNHLLKSLCNILKERSNKESSYATFLQTEWVSVGLYHIIYKIPVNIEDKKDHLEQSIGLYINNVLQKNIQRTFGVIDPDYKNCMSIIGDDIIYIPENTLLQLKNNGFSNKSKNINSYNKEGSSASINIVKIG